MCFKHIWKWRASASLRETKDLRPPPFPVFHLFAYSTGEKKRERQGRKTQPLSSFPLFSDRSDRAREQEERRDGRDNSSLPGPEGSPYCCVVATHDKWPIDNNMYCLSRVVDECEALQTNAEGVEVLLIHQVILVDVLPSRILSLLVEREKAFWPLKLASLLQRWLATMSPSSRCCKRVVGKEGPEN